MQILRNKFLAEASTAVTVARVLRDKLDGFCQSRPFLFLSTEVSTTAAPNITGAYSAVTSVAHKQVVSRDC
jgi:hypothetical protein